MTDQTRLYEGNHPAQNPPPISKTDAFIVNWHENNATEFTRDFGMMPSLIDELGLSVSDRNIFIMKLGLIYRSQLRRTGGNK